MAKVTVYKVKVHDVAVDSAVLSRRMATRRGAETMRGFVIEDTAVEIDDSLLETGEQWTARGFDPPSSKGSRQHLPLEPFDAMQTLQYIHRHDFFILLEKALASYSKGDDFPIVTDKGLITTRSNGNLGYNGCCTTRYVCRVSREWAH
jgi:hypothetical protein